MESNNTNQSPTKTLKILWGALLGSQFMYAFVLYTRNQGYDGEIGLKDPSMLPKMASVAICAYIVSFFLPKKLLSYKKTEIRNPSLNEMAEFYLPAMVIRLALFEAVVIMGFFLAFKSYDINYFLAPLSLNIGLFLMNFPSEQRIKDAFLS